MKKIIWFLIIAALFTTAFAIEAHHKKTKVFVYKPILPATKLDVQKGSCFANAAGLNRPDAWRCKTNGAIIDPCFEIKKTDKLICPKEYTGTETVILKLIKHLPKSKTMPYSISEAKRLDLPGGVVCTLYNGTMPIVNYKNKKVGIQYGCIKQIRLNNKEKKTESRSIIQTLKKYAVQFFTKVHHKNTREQIGILEDSIKTGNVWIAKKVYYSQDREGQWKVDFIKNTTIEKVWR